VEIQKVALIKTDSCSFDIIADFAECNGEKDTVKSIKALIRVSYKKLPLLPKPFLKQL